MYTTPPLKYTADMADILWAFFILFIALLLLVIANKKLIEWFLVHTKTAIYWLPGELKEICMCTLLTLCIINNYSLISRWIVAEYLPSREAAR